MSGHEPESHGLEAEPECAEKVLICFFACPAHLGHVLGELSDMLVTNNSNLWPQL